MHTELDFQSGLSRRAVIKGIAGLVGCALCSPRVGAATSPWRIDVHHHFIPPAYRDFFAVAKTPSGGPPIVPPTNWSLEATLEAMERGGTAKAVLSIFTPTDVGTLEQRVRLSRDINEYAAKLRADHPGRFGHFASLPMPDMDACLTELAYAFDTLKVDGVAIYSNVGDRWVGDASFEPLYAELNRRKAIVFVHPVIANCCRGLIAGIPDNIIEYGTDTSRVIASLIFNGITTRYPDIRFLFPHGGGTMPYLIERFLGGTKAEIIPGVVTQGQGPPYVPHQPPAGALHEVRKMFYDTAQCANPVAMAALRKLVPTSQILFGTDYFYRTPEETAAGLESCGIFSKSELRAIGRDNAVKLLAAI